MRLLWLGAAMAALVACSDNSASSAGRSTQGNGAAGGIGGAGDGGGNSGGGGGGLVAPYQLEVTWQSCPLISDAIALDAECATIEVPLDWDAADGETIELFVKRKPATVASEGQIWFLAGGPGQSSVGFEGLVDQVAGQAPQLSFYMIDHRGVGRSTRLGCPEQEALASAGANQITVDEMPDCLATVRAQYSDEALSHFSTDQAARDVGELIAHLRAAGETVAVWGGSYGTDWADAYAVYFPEQADALVLGAIAVGGELATVDMRFDAVARQYLERCEADLCASKFQAEFGMAARDVAIATMSGSDAAFCPAIAALGWTPAILKPLLGQLIYSWENRKLVPAMIYRAARCDTSDVGVFTHLADLFSQPPTEIPLEQELWGMFITHHIIKSELWTDPPISAAELTSITDAAIVINGTPSLMVDSYEGWPVYERPVRGFGSPGGHVLLVHGELDFTPPAPLPTGRRPLPVAARRQHVPARAQFATRARLAHVWRIQLRAEHDVELCTRPVVTAELSR